MGEKFQMNGNRETETRLRKIENRVSLLVALSFAQLALLAFLVIWLVFVPKKMTLILLGIALIAFLAIFHKQVPGWAGSIGRLIGARIWGNKSSKADSDQIA